MENLIDTILSKPVYMIIVGIAIIIIIILLMKSFFKYFVFACILFIAFLAYVHFTGGSVEETINDAKNKGKEIIKEGREKINK